MAKAIVPPMAPFDSRSSGSSCWSADHSSALTPSDIDSASVATPRTSGTLAQRFAQSGRRDVRRCRRRAVRTATAHVDAPRIMTPSMTAWPPM